MSLPRYPKYKASGVEWVDEVPSHWDCTRIKHVARPGIKTFVDGDWIETPFITTEGVRLLQCGNVGTGIYEEQGFRYISEETFSSFGCTEVEPNDVLICRLQSSRTILAGRACLAPQLGVKMITSVDNCIVKTSSDFDPRYIVYQLSMSAYLSFIEVIARGGTRDRISRSMLGDIELVAPPVAEQTQIASFLDRETEKIDFLVGEQRRLIKLLTEKRQALISHAVVKGLNRHAILKPSGIGWLGDVPDHWQVLPLKRIVAVPITDGPHETPQFFHEGVPFVSAEAVSSGRIDFSKVRACISEEDNIRYSLKYSPKLYDIYMVKSGATTGITAIVEDRTDFNIWSPLAVIRCGEEADAYFVLNFMRSRNFLEAVSLNWSFGTQQNIGMGVIENLACTVPPVEEQSEIARFLHHETAKLDSLTAEAERGIKLLQERRAALISAAVTGKIDVRAESPE